MVLHSARPSGVHMQRRELIAGIGAATVWLFVARAQQAKRIYKIGYLEAGSPSTVHHCSLRSKRHFESSAIT
jgi:hypothetical protein